ncbi:RNA polymerase sigma factor (sigma-70 family) [Paenibacillus barcinonensis]|uniref:RNA polymerase sigma factor (Sigma-70 family) n=2 Tax=Paenibacillus barcinonensis TaxID=198119 RepID=A0A2V4VKT6_PAEBA|nr:RNA polymerase sigma factor [Paenibacillus barcinonensis]PYE45510.1 RNA polymerase sigma factor (sigma-70 family) [Paenibacillus barcinonensis]
MAFVKSVDRQINSIQHEWNNTTSSYYMTNESNERNTDYPTYGMAVANAAQVMGRNQDMAGENRPESTLPHVLPDLMGSLYAYCLSLTKSMNEAEDLMQETCLKALSSAAAHAVKRTEAFNWEAYLIRIARNTWIDAIRKQEKLRSIVDGLKPVMSAYVEEEPWEELESAVSVLIRELSPLQRVIYILREMMGYTAAETAGMLNTTEGAVKAALNRARTALSKVKQQLEEAGTDAIFEMSSVGGAADAEQEQLRSYLLAFRQGDTARLIDLCLNRMYDPMAVAGTILQSTLPSTSMQPVMAYHEYTALDMNSMSYRVGYTILLAA